MFKYHVLALLLGTILDYVFGHIYSIWNPFDSIKKWIAFLDRALLGDEIILLEPSKQRSLGLWFVFLNLVPVFAITTFFTMLCFEISPVVGIIFEAFATYLCIDGNRLFYGARDVMNTFYGHSLHDMASSARTFVGLDEVGDSEADITKTTITHLANETSDAVISPIFVMFLFGPVGGFVYRTIDLMDKQVGYLDKRYSYFGYFTAKLNTIIDFIPARFAGALTVFTARFTFGGFNGKNARFIHLRDRNKAISAFAGALGISLKDGQVGDDDRIPEARDIRPATKLMRNDFVICQLILLFLLLFF